MPYTTLGDLQTISLNSNFDMDNPCIILSLNCGVNILDNINVIGNYTANARIFTLPTTMDTYTQTYLPVCVKKDDDIIVSYLSISSVGVVSMPINLSTGDIIYTNGLIFNCLNHYYNETLGNNFPQGTSPLN